MAEFAAAFKFGYNDVQMFRAYDEAKKLRGDELLGFLRKINGPSQVVLIHSVLDDQYAVTEDTNSTKGLMQGFYSAVGHERFKLFQEDACPRLATYNAKKLLDSKLSLVDMSGKEVPPPYFYVLVITCDFRDGCNTKREVSISGASFTFKTVKLNIRGETLGPSETLIVT